MAHKVATTTTKNISKTVKTLSTDLCSPPACSPQSSHSLYCQPSKTASAPKFLTISGSTLIRRRQVRETSLSASSHRTIQPMRMSKASTRDCPRKATMSGPAESTSANHTILWMKSLDSSPPNPLQRMAPALLSWRHSHLASYVCLMWEQERDSSV